MIAVVYGFPTKVAALQFEWAWQHPKRSKTVRTALGRLKWKSGYKSCLNIAVLMMSLKPFCNFGLGILATCDDSFKVLSVVKELNPTPAHMCLRQGGVGSLPRYTEKHVVPDADEEDDDEGGEGASTAYSGEASGLDYSSAGSAASGDESRRRRGKRRRARGDEVTECGLCRQSHKAWLLYECPRCLESFHVVCLAPEFLGPAASVRLIPVSGRCPQCTCSTAWVAVVASVRKAQRVAAQATRTRQAGRPRSNSASSAHGASAGAGEGTMPTDDARSAPLFSASLVQPTPASILHRLHSVPEIEAVGDGSGSDSTVTSAGGGAAARHRIGDSTVQARTNAGSAADADRGASPVFLDISLDDASTSSSSASDSGSQGLTVVE